MTPRSRSTTSRSGRWRRRLQGAGAVVAIAVVVAGAAVAWLGWRGLQARDALAQARPVVGEVQRDVLAGDAQAAGAALGRLQADTGRARTLTHDPVWDAAAHLPAVGDDLRAVQQATAVVDDVARRALPPLVEAAGSLDPAAIQADDGSFDVAALRDAAPRLQRSRAAMEAAEQDAVAIDVTGADARVAAPVEDLRTQLAEAARVTSTASRAAALLPGMLGADGPRTFLLLFQNNAEPRALGGIVGATALVRAEAGRVELVSQRAAGAFGPYAEPVLPLTDEQLRVHGDRLGRFVQNVTGTPDFDLTARLAREMYRRETGTVVDGVIATDPVALSYLLRATGPVDLPTGERLDADNAVELLLSDVYERYEEPRAQDAFFAVAASGVFGALLDGGADPAALAEQLARAAGERRTLVWSADPAEQEQLAGTALAGGLPAGEAGGPAVGVYLNDATAAKMGYYLRPEVTLTEPCSAGLATHTVRLVLRSEAPADAATSLPDYVLGGPSSGDLPRGGVRTEVMVYGPAGGGIEALRLDGAVVPFASQVEGGRPVGSLVVDLLPGQESVVEADVVDTTGGAALELWTTPGPSSTESRGNVTRCSFG